MWEILISNLITTTIVGGSILGYHLYRKYMELQYYRQVRAQVLEGISLFSHVMLYYYGIKGQLDISAIKHILQAPQLKPYHDYLKPFNFNFEPVNSHIPHFGSTMPFPCKKNTFPKCPCPVSPSNNNIDDDDDTETYFQGSVGKCPLNKSEPEKYVINI